MADLQHVEAAKHRSPKRVESTPEHTDRESEAAVQRAVAPTFRQGRIVPRGLSPRGMMVMQRTAGNAAVNHLLQQPPRGEEAFRGGTSAPTPQQAIIVQRVQLNGTVGSAHQTFKYGLVKGSYTLADNKADAHIDPGDEDNKLEQADMLKAVQDIYQAMQARAGAGGAAGVVERNPQGAVALKTVVELLGQALGGFWGKAEANLQQWRRKKFGELTKSKMSDELDQAIIPEHMAFLGALVGVGGVSMKPVLGEESSPAEFNQNMLENSEAGKARMETYRQRLVADRAVSMSVSVPQAVLPQIITLLQP